MKRKKFLAERGKFIVVIEDPCDGVAGKLYSVGNVERSEAEDFAKGLNDSRKSVNDCIFWVYDDQGNCINRDYVFSC